MVVVLLDDVSTIYIILHHLVVTAGREEVVRVLRVDPHRVSHLAVREGRNALARLHVPEPDEAVEGGREELGSVRAKIYVLDTEAVAAVGPHAAPVVVNVPDLGGAIHGAGEQKMPILRKPADLVDSLRMPRPRVHDLLRQIAGVLPLWIRAQARRGRRPAASLIVSLVITVEHTLRCRGLRVPVVPWRKKASALALHHGIVVLLRSPPWLRLDSFARLLLRRGLGPHCHDILPLGLLGPRAQARRIVGFRKGRRQQRAIRRPLRPPFLLLRHALFRARALGDCSGISLEVTVGIDGEALVVEAVELAFEVVVLHHRGFQHSSSGHVLHAVHLHSPLLLEWVPRPRCRRRHERRGQIPLALPHENCTQRLNAGLGVAGFTARGRAQRHAVVPGPPALQRIARRVHRRSRIHGARWSGQSANCGALLHGLFFFAVVVG
mmetsp:Transcript_9489/g.35528  ORF Transcript_9489/g.35528 Transcript_9489/m.35528 type:complete len:437 (-) Transcript_9489:131-1441(-)